MSGPIARRGFVIHAPGGCVTVPRDYRDGEGIDLIKEGLS